ncbi:MAG TPA: hypothetical protein VMX15_00190 [Candidatus Heimdallarchaeota archaeon]|nr:hypothetical protein [Candidatus Heimdallarchaeota archaeon]
MSINDDLRAEIDAAVGAVADETQTEETQKEVAQEEGAKEEESQKETEEQEKEAEGEETQEEGAKEEPSKEEGQTPPPLSDETLTRAVRAGLSLVEARSYPSDRSLASTCSLIEAADARAKAASEVAQKGFKNDEVEDPLAIFDNLNTDEFEPEVVELLGTLVTQIRAQRDALHELRSGHEQAARASQETVVREVEVWFDQQVEGLGTDLHECLGEGGYRSLSPGSPQLAKRDAIAEQIAVTLAGYQAMGRQPPPREEVFEQAVKSVLRDEFTQAERKKIQQELRRMKGNIVQRASHGTKTDSTKSPEEEIAARLDEKYFVKE